MNFKFYAGVLGTRRPEILVKSDAAGEITGAVRDLGWHAEPSLANCWPHNVRHETWIRCLKSIHRANMLQGGAPVRAWDAASSYAAIAYAFSAPAPILPYEKDAAGNTLPGNPKIGKSCWEAHTGTPFDGPLQPFGRLCYYLDTDTHPLLPQTSPGIFCGWRLESGMRYRGALQICDYELARAGRFNEHYLRSIPEKQVHFPEELVFPFAQARALAINSMTKVLPPPSAPPSRVNLIPLPFSEEEGAPSGAGTGGTETPVELPKLKPRFQITQVRMIQYGATPGCDACENLTTGHTKECRERFANILQTEGLIPRVRTEVEELIEAVDALPPSGEATAVGEVPAAEELLDEAREAVATWDDPPGTPPVLPEPFPYDDPADLFSGLDMCAKVIKAAPCQEFHGWLCCFAQNQHEMIGAALAPKRSAREGADADVESVPTEPADAGAKLMQEAGCKIPPDLNAVGSGGSGKLFDMEDYCRDTVELYKTLSGVTTLKHTLSPNPPEGSLTRADECEKGRLSGEACRVLMKCLWLARLGRPDCQNPIGTMSTHLNCWSVNDDKRMYRLICYINSTPHYRLQGQVRDPPELLKLCLFCDADFAGESDNTRSTSGGYLVLVGPNTWFPIAWISKRQTSTSRSTTEAEVVAVANSLFSEALPMLDLFDLILGRPVELLILEDNQATIKVLKRGYSPKLRHIQRTHKVNLGSIKEVLDRDFVSMPYCPTDLQAADIFTKTLAPSKWDNALRLLGMRTDLGGKAPKSVAENPDEPCGEIAQGAEKLDQSCAILPAKVQKGIYGVVVMADETLEWLPAEKDFHRDFMVSNINAIKCLPARCGRTRPSGKLPGWGTLYEICTGPESHLGATAQEYPHTSVVRITQKEDFNSKKCVDSISQAIKERPGISLHGSLPCTVWSQWQLMALHRYGPKYAKNLVTRRAASRRQLRSFIKLAQEALDAGGEVSFEWPRHCAGWMLPELQEFIAVNGLYVAFVDGCACGMVDSKGDPILKQWSFVTSSQRLATGLSALRCAHERGYKHGEICGKETKITECYPIPLCRTMLSSLFSHHRHAPAMLCCEQDPEPQSHREKEPLVPDFGVSPATCPVGVLLDMEALLGDEDPSEGVDEFPPSIPLGIRAAVTKLLSREEMKSQKAQTAIRDEGRALVEEGTWLESTVTEKLDLVDMARKNKESIVLGDLMTICSIKFFEKPEEWWKWKGRIVFRGDNAKDEQGLAAVYQELSSSPTAVQGVNANIAYGCIPGHSSSVSDALRAYIQSLLRSKKKTWVSIPRSLWPPHWHKLGYKKPMCLLQKALYGHPESGGHWEHHLTEAVIACGGEAVPAHPSSFWFPAERLLLTVYVDDLLLSGPTENHEKLWKKLRFGPHPINLDDSEPLHRFLGRTHTNI